MKVHAFNLEFEGLERSKVIETEERIKFITTVNSEFIVEANSDPDFKHILDHSISTFDGQIPYFLARLTHKEAFEKISGSELIYDVFKKCTGSGETVFLLGDKPSVNDTAVSIGKQKYNVCCWGFSPPYEGSGFSAETNADMLSHIADCRPTYLFVAFGAKKQEQWIFDNLAELEAAGVKWVIGCGGSISFFAGTIKRAPVLLQRLGLEGVYRLLQEPKIFRFKRILKSLLVFRYMFAKKNLN